MAIGRRRAEEALAFPIRDSLVRRSLLLSAVVRIAGNPQGRIAFGGLLLLIFAAIFADFYAKDPIAQTAEGQFLGPSWEHLFGTDELRRDLFARTVHGLRISLTIALVSSLSGAAIGISLGFVSGYAGGWAETAAMRVVDALLAFPGLLMALAIITILGPGGRNVAIAIAFLTIPAFARLARAQMLTEKHNDYVLAAKTVGASPLRIIFRHIGPNALPPLLTQVSLFMALAVLLEAALSFLGLGTKPPDPSLGLLLNNAKTFLREAWFYPVFPGLALAFLLLCLNLLADVINEATSPWARRRV